MIDAKASSTRAIVLFAHGARDPEWAGPVRRLAARLTERDPSVRAVPAFLEFMTPGLDAAVDALAEDGTGEILVVPVFLAQGGHLKRDVPVLVEAARARHPGIDIRLVAPVGEDDGVLDAMAEFALASLSDR
ncbi:MAG: CbiX/SirB N-terminal domain-containing protein [Rhodocyclaceae bacterium]|nr:CbiX/SirB N-terminal domain-containing protein [Rhodocyclaceae bacterium]